MQTRLSLKETSRYMWSIYWIVLYGKSLDTPNLDCLRSWRMTLNFSFALQRHPHADDLRRVWANLELNITNSQHFPTSSKMDGFLHVFTIRTCCSLDYFGRLWKSLPSQDSNLVEPKARKNAGYKQQAQLEASPRIIRTDPVTNHLDSLDWFKGKITGNHGFYHQI